MNKKKHNMVQINCASLYMTQNNNVTQPNRWMCLRHHGLLIWSFLPYISLFFSLCIILRLSFQHCWSVSKLWFHCWYVFCWRTNTV